jgi:hypothetical protein
MENIYDRPLHNLTKEETQYLGLLFSVMALGCMYNNLDDNDPGSMTYRQATEEGLKYYKAGRSILQDITDCRDLISLQTLLFIILFPSGHIKPQQLLPFRWHRAPLVATDRPPSTPAARKDQRH